MFWNNKIESVESYSIWVIDCMDSPRGVWILENDSVENNCMGGSVESDCKDNSDVNILKW